MTPLVRCCNDNRLRDSWAAFHSLLDLRQFNAVSSDFHLSIDAAEKLKIASR
jgi:hypothetical protein